MCKRNQTQTNYNYKHTVQSSQSTVGWVGGSLGAVHIQILSGMGVCGGVCVGGWSVSNNTTIVCGSKIIPIAVKLITGSQRLKFGKRRKAICPCFSKLTEVVN